MPPTSVSLLARCFGACFLSANLDSVVSALRVKRSVVYIKLHITFLVVPP